MMTIPLRLTGNLLSGERRHTRSLTPVESAAVHAWWIECLRPQITEEAVLALPRKPPVKQR